jgi:hypothetical protein
MEAKIAAGYFTEGSVPSEPTWPRSRGVALSEALLQIESFVSHHPLAPLHDPGTIRAPLRAIVRGREAGVSPSFTARPQPPADAVAERVAALTLRALPGPGDPLPQPLAPLRSRRCEPQGRAGHRTGRPEPADRARAHFDLTVVSVLLDAGAGADWRYTEAAATAAPATPGRWTTPMRCWRRWTDRPARQHTRQHRCAEPAPPRAEGRVYTRSEGLGVASFAPSWRAVFRPTPASPAARRRRPAPHRCGGAARHLPEQPQQPDGRPGRPRRLLARLGQALQAEATRDGLPARPGLLYDRLTAGGTPHQVRRQRSAGRSAALPVARSGPAAARCKGCRPATSGRTAGPALRGRAVAGPDRTTEGWVPFHKLSQWMSYSLLEPLQWAGLSP